jgi:hypothetical protein
MKLIKIFIIFIVFVILIYLSLFPNIIFTGTKNFIIGTSCHEVTCILTVKNSYDHKKLIKILDSYEIFNYKLFANLFLYKSKYKTYNINNENKCQDSIFIINIFEHKNFHTFNIKCKHAIFDMSLIINIIKAYITNDNSYKKINFINKFYKTDINMLKTKYVIKNEIYKKKIFTFNKLFIKKIKELYTSKNIFLSELDILFSLLIKKYLLIQKKDNCTIGIIKTFRNKENMNHCGNSISVNCVNINNLSIKNIASTIRSSYNNNNSIDIKTNIDIYITSWVIKDDMILSIDCTDFINEKSKRKVYDWFIVLAFDKDNYIINLSY